MATNTAVGRPRLRRSAAAAGVLAIVVVASPPAASSHPAWTASASPARSVSASAAGSHGLAGCPVFPANNYWNADISRLPVNARSDQWLSHMSPGRDLHPDFGPSYGAQPVPYGIAVTVVDATHPTVPVSFRYASESDQVPYPFGADTRIEGGRSSDGDRHAIAVDRT